MRTALLAAAIWAMAGTMALAQLRPNWTRVTADAGWQARDSSGEAVLHDRLWILGGWFQSFEAPPRDVWSSADGKSWKLEAKEAPWRHSDLPMTLVFDDKLWLLGGWYNGRLPGHSASAEVWSSADGVNWQQVTANAGWSPRLAAGAVVFQGKMWILGGTENYYFGDESSLKNDVWHSVDGKTWTRTTADAGWSPRAYHQAAVLGERMYVLGGGNYVPKYHAKNDVWSTTDGVHWERVAENAPWPGRLWFPAVTFRNRLWVLGGWSNEPAKNWNDVWHSREGKTWKRLETANVWKERHEHSAYVFQNAIWIAGGHAQPLSSDVWKLELPPDWTGE